VGEIYGECPLLFFFSSPSLLFPLLLLTMHTHTHSPQPAFGKRVHGSRQPK
jgi:hypothetical protein